jgi:hypothetical protein
VAACSWIATQKCRREPLSNRQGAEIAGWAVWAAILASVQLEVLTLPLLFASKERLIEIDSLDFFNPTIWESEENIQKEIWDSIRDRRSLTGAWLAYFIVFGKGENAGVIAKTVLCVPLGALLLSLWLERHGYFSNPQPWINAVLVGATLFLSLAVLLNVGFLIAAARERSRAADAHEGKKAGSIQREKWENYARRIALAAVLYITSVLSFAYVVYPHIPEQKAGGNYATVKGVCVHLVKATPIGECPSNILPSLGKREAYVVLEEDADWVYLANDHSAGGPHRWSFPGFGANYSRPNVYAIAGAASQASMTPSQTIWIYGALYRGTRVQTTQRIRAS